MFVYVRARERACYIRGIKICSVSVRIQVYFGVFPAGFDLRLEMKSVFLERAILNRRSPEGSCSCV